MRKGPEHVPRQQRHLLSDEIGFRFWWFSKLHTVHGIAPLLTAVVTSLAVPWRSQVYQLLSQYSRLG